MRIMIFGASGMLGWAVSGYFRKKGYQVQPVSRVQYDIGSEPISKLVSLIEREKPELIVNCAGVIKPQIAKTSIENVLRVNAVFPRNLAKIAESAGSKCIHVTTDCVYSGRKGAYTEDDVFDADDVYGMSKNAGDISDCMVLRTSIIGEENGQARSLVEWAKSQRAKKVNGFTNHFWNGVTTHRFAEIVESIVERNLFKKGIFHVHSPDANSKLRMLQIFDEIYELGLEINPVEGPEFCDRTLASKHELTKIVSQKSLLDQVRDMKPFFAGLRAD